MRTLTNITRLRQNFKQKKPPVDGADRGPVTGAQPLGVGLRRATLFAVSYRANHKH
jgi:hypothetical protein